MPSSAAPADATNQPYATWHARVAPGHIRQACSLGAGAQGLHITMPCPGATRNNGANLSPAPCCHLVSDHELGARGKGHCHAEDPGRLRRAAQEGQGGGQVGGPFADCIAAVGAAGRPGWVVGVPSLWIARPGGHALSLSSIPHAAGRAWTHSLASRQLPAGAAERAKRRRADHSHPRGARVCLVPFTLLLLNISQPTASVRRCGLCLCPAASVLLCVRRRAAGRGIY